MRSKVVYLKISLVLFHVTNIISSTLGLAPYRLKISPQSRPKIGFTFAFSYSRLKCIYNILMIILHTGICIVSVPHLKSLSYPNDTVRTVTISFCIMGTAMAILVIIVFFVYQRDIIRTGNELNEFDEQYGHIMSGKMTKNLGDCRSFITIVLTLASWIGVVIAELLEEDDYIYLVTAGLTEASAGWFVVQYGLIINVLKARLKGLNNALILTTRGQNLEERKSLRQRRIPSERIIIQNLIIIRQARNSIYKVARDVSRLHSFPVLIAIFYFFCAFIDLIYYTIMRIIDGYVNATYINPTLWILIGTYPVIVLTSSVNAFHAEESETAKILYDVTESHTPNRNIELELNNFSVELLHKNIKFNACGLFSLDSTLLGSMFMTTVIYLLILVQFKTPEEISKLAGAS